MDKSKVFSIGHSNVELKFLIDKLIENKIDLVVDVRGRPYSSYNPQFNKEPLQRAIKEQVGDYAWRGSLGGFQEWNEKSFADLDEMLLAGDKFNICFMCSEGDYRKCHRGEIITREVMKRGFMIEHISLKGKNKLIDDIV